MKSLCFVFTPTRLCVLLLALLLATPAFGSWRVIPIRLEFDQKARSGVITITNDGEKPISFSVEARKWTQDEEGRDRYEETSEILFFPKILTIQPNSERIIRAGIKVPAVEKEKTYRLFIKQQADPRTNGGTEVAIAIRFGVPIFSTPPREEIRGEIVRATLDEGDLEVDIHNGGNTHFRVNTLRVLGRNAAGETVLTQELNGGYLLAGSERTFSATIPEDLCERIEVIDIEVVSDRIQLDRGIDVVQGMCTAP